jgi:nicotinate-nucleotide--dimethylbenzimidazole phosphoribosyltransferase
LDFKSSVDAIRPLDEAAMQAAQARQDMLTKPQGSLGRLEGLSVQLAGIARRCPPPRPARKAVIVFAGDHGVVAQGVSAYPQEVTPQMVLNFLRGGAAINVLARQAGAYVVVVDAGVAVPLAANDGLILGKIAPGTADMSAGPAMTRAEAEAAVALGLRVTQGLIDEGLDLLACGEMGIGNTTPATAIIAAVTGKPPIEVVGPGTGLPPGALAHKAAVVERALALNRPDSADGWDLLAKVGGFEIGAIAGAMLAAAAHAIPVVVDGFIATSAAIIAAALAPGARAYMIAGHRSAEPGHDVALAYLGLTPLLDLGMRLGEGTGAVLAMHLVEAAACLLGEMATFAEAGVSEKAD